MRTHLRSSECLLCAGHEQGGALPSGSPPPTWSGRLSRSQRSRWQGSSPGKSHHAWRGMAASGWAAGNVPRGFSEPGELNWDMEYGSACQAAERSGPCRRDPGWRGVRVGADSAAAGGHLLHSGGSIMKHGLLPLGLGLGFIHPVFPLRV